MASTLKEQGMIPGVGLIETHEVTTAGPTGVTLSNRMKRPTRVLGAVWAAGGTTGALECTISSFVVTVKSASNCLKTATITIVGT